MQDVLYCAMGLDVHKNSIVACLLKGDIDTAPEPEIRTFGTLFSDLRQLRE